MDKVYDRDSEQRKIERLILCIFTLYNAAMMARTATYGWDSWIGSFLFCGIAACWIMYAANYKTYSFRAKLTATMVEMCLFLYAHQAGNVSGGVPIIIAFVIFLGLYEILEIIYITVFFAVFIFFYHGIVIHTISFSTPQDCLTLAVQVANIVMVEVVTYIWVKKRSESDKRVQGVIRELRTAERSKDEFLANVSHEIRTPINTICGMSEIILREEVSPQVREQLLHIQMSGQNLMAVVSNILDFSELQSGRMELEEEAYNITSTINDLITMALARKGNKNIELIVDCDANIPCGLLGDEKKLRRVIINLVDNAIKFTDEGGICISIGYRKESYGINLLVTIKDTGIGMDEESLEKIFTGFHQVDASSKRIESGVGLGLAISKLLVRKMGGALTINSKKGKGTIAKFVLPQKVLDETPIASLRDKTTIKVATYVDMEQFSMMTIRDEYSRMIVRMVEQLKGRCHVCRNLAELQRRVEKEEFSHIFTSIVEYRQNKSYFDEVSKNTDVVVVLNYEDEKMITNPRLIKVFKPFYILSIVSVLNGMEDARKASGFDKGDKFVTQNVHVLVVDDNNMNIKVAEGLLSRYNIKVTTASSGQEALEKIESCNYDFVFMDHMMPEMDGVETLQRIRRKVGTYYQKVPIVALTANAVAGTREMLLSEGFSDFLEKPIERSVLERVLKRNLPPEKIVIQKQEEVSKTEAVTEAGSGEIEREQTAPLERRYQEESSANGEASLVDFLAAEGLDVQKGVVYCGGEEQYVEIVRGFCEESTDILNSIQQLYEGEDWTNYTIVVHGVKSAMGSIGAKEQMELAKGLEFAGKEGRIQDIIENHGKLVDAYQGLFRRLKSNERIYQEKTEATSDGAETELEFTSLNKDEFEQIMEELENAAFSLDGDKLRLGLDKLQGCMYNGLPLTEVVHKAIRKVEMSDYLSAIEMIAKQKEKAESEVG